MIQELLNLYEELHARAAYTPLRDVDWNVRLPSPVFDVMIQYLVDGGGSVGNGEFINWAIPDGIIRFEKQEAYATYTVPLPGYYQFVRNGSSYINYMDVGDTVESTRPIIRI